MSDETTPQVPADDAAPVFPTLDELAAMLPQYEFHDILGVGGMGAVYLARQVALDRWVAIKLLPQSVSQNQEDAARFITEARSMAKLTHTHIATVYDFGQTPQGHLYLVMEYVEGLDLHRLIHRDEVTPHRIRALVPQLCDALQFAHDHGVIHRDIKPANILITADWQAKIVDFGLAGQRDEVIGDVEYGTPEYVAPERLEPGSLVDHRADIYALGVVIHEMFTKKTPQAAGSSAMTGMPEAFATVIARCTAPDPAKRFQKAGEIKTYLTTADSSKPSHAGAQKSAPPPHLQARVKRPQHDVDTGPQNSGEAARWLWAAAVVVLLAVGYWFVQKQQTTPAPMAEEKAVPAPEIAPAPKEENKPETPPPATAETKPSEMPKTGTAEPPKPVEPPVMPAASTPTVVSNLPEGPFKPPPGDFAILKRLQGHTGNLYGSSILEDQRHIASTGFDSTIRLWDAAAGIQVKSITSPIGIPSNLSASPNGQVVLISSVTTDQAAILDLSTGRTIGTVRGPDSYLNNAMWANDGKTVYLTCRNLNGGVYHWAPAKGSVLTKFSDWNRAAYDVFSLPGGAGQEPMLIVTGAQLKISPQQPANASAPSLTSERYVAGLFNSSGQLLRELPDYSIYYSRLKLSPDRTLLAGGANEFAIFSTPELKKLRVIPPPPTTATMVSAWTQDSRLLLIASSNGNLRIAEADTGTELGSLSIGIRAGSISISKDASWAVVSGYSMDSRAPKPEESDVLILRLPDLSKLGSDKGILAFATRQLSRLDTLDPELAGLRKSTVTSPDAIASDEQLVTAVRELTSKYGGALRRASATASPKDQIAMIAEADAIASGHAVPDTSTDAATAGEHKRFRGIYRQQLAQLEVRRQQSADALRKSLEPSVKALSTKRSSEGDRIGAARCEALLASYDSLPPFASVIATAFISSPVASAPPQVAASPAIAAAPTAVPPPIAATGIKLQRTGKPGELIKIERSTKNGYIGDNRSRVGSVPPNLGPVLQVACTNYCAAALLPNGTLKGWGSWNGAGAAFTIPPEAQDVIAVELGYDIAVALLANGSVFIWEEEGAKRTWNPPAGVTVTGLRKGDPYHHYALCSDNVIRPLELGTDPAIAPPANTQDLIDVAGSNQVGWFAVKKDGSIIHWGKENLYLGEQHLNVKDALAVGEANNFLAVLHKDGTVDGWGETQDRQRIRVRKYPGATRILPDPAGRIFLVAKSGAEWSAVLNPANYEYYEEQRLGNMEGKLKGCTSVALSAMYVFAVKPGQ